MALTVDLKSSYFSSYNLLRCVRDILGGSKSFRYVSVGPWTFPCVAKVLNDFRISVVQIILSNGKSFFFKVVEDSNTNPTQLESRQSEFEWRCYGRNTNVYPFLGRRPVHGKRGDRSLFDQRLIVGRRPVCGKRRDRSSFNQRLPIEKETGQRKT